MSRRLLRSVPRSPFSTPLSGSAKETETRIRNLFQYKKMRPPALALLLACALALTCGGLVSCQRQEAVSPGIAMAVQYYGGNGTCIEIPTLVPPEGGTLDQGAAAINQDLEALAQSYDWVWDSGENSLVAAQCLFFPSETERYLNLTFLQTGDGYGGDGNIYTWCYDKEARAQVTVQQALEQAGLSEEQLCSSLDQYVAANPGFASPVVTPVPLDSPSQIVGFRMAGDGRAVFYLSVTTDFVSTQSGGEYDPWTHLYVWDDGSFTRYDYLAQTTAPLVPAEELISMDSPLWCQRYFGQETPEELLARTALEDFLYVSPSPQLTTLLDYAAGDQHLLVVQVDGFPHVAGLSNLVWGVWDAGTESLAGEPDSLRGDHPAVSHWVQGEDLYLLLSSSGAYQGYETCQGLYAFRFGPQGLERITQLPAAARTAGVSLPEDGDFLSAGEGTSDYWYHHKALPTVGGVEIFVRTEAWERAFPQTGDLPQWTYEGYVPLSQEAADLYGAAIPFLRAELEEWSGEGSGSLDTAVHQEYQIVSAGEPVPNPCADHPESSGLEFWVETPEGESFSFWVILDGAGRPVALHPAGDAGLTVE